MPALSRHHARVLCLVLLLFAAGLRLRGLDWDGGHHLHPDERFISIVEAALADPAHPLDYLDSGTSPLNPYNRGFESYVYGTMPMLAARYAGRLVGLAGYDGTYLAGRALSALLDLLTVWLVYRLARRFAGRGTSLTAAAFIAGSPLAIQLSHFWTVDPWLTAFTTAALLAAVRLGQGRVDVGTILLGGVATGFAVAAKVTGLALFAPIGFALAIGACADPGALTWRRAWKAVMAGLVIGAIGLLSARVALPYAFAPGGSFTLRLDPRWLHDIERLSTLSQSVAAWPPNFQWADRSVLHPLRAFVLWGGSPGFGVLALGAVPWLLWSLYRRRAWALAATPLLLHALVVFAYHELSLVKAMRYYYPLYPAGAVLAALVCARIVDGPTSPTHRPPARRDGWWRRAVVGACVAGTLLSGIALSAVHGREHTRVRATRWIYDHVQPAGVVLNESWDDGQPMAMPGHTPAPYQGEPLEIVGPETPAKLDAIVDGLTRAEVIAITSNRAYASLTRLPDVFPIATAYYHALFAEQLGFRLVADIASYPSLGPFRVPDDAAEETFTVYDHPRVLLYRKTPEFSPERVRALLAPAVPTTPQTLHDWERQPRSLRRTQAPVRPPVRPDVRQQPPGAVDSVTATFVWYVALAMVGLLATPLVFATFTRLDDRGLGFSRLIGVALATLVTRLLLWTATVPNGPVLAWLGVACVAAVSAAVLVPTRASFLALVRTHRRALIESELVFAIGFALFVSMRLLSPEITWGEKPMDLSMLNALLRTPRLPPSDPWFSGGTFNYYYFGQEGIALLTHLTGLPSAFTYNLAFGLLGGAILQGAYSLGSSWGGRRLTGVVAAGLTLVVGNLAGLRAVWQGQALDWHYFWATSRVVQDTINEYPLWSLLFADLHAHVFAIACLLIVLAAILQVIRLGDSTSARERLASAVALGLAIGTHALTNAWDVPLLAGLVGLVVPVVIVLSASARRAACLRAVSIVTTAAATALLVAGPTWPSGAGSPAIGWQTGARADGMELLLIFGLPLLLVAAWSLRATVADWFAARRWLAPLTLLALAVVALVAIDLVLAVAVLALVAIGIGVVRSSDDRLACAVAATGVALVLMPQYVYVSDRMNTFFKFHLEAWVLLAVATSVLVTAGRQGVADAGYRGWHATVRLATWAVCAVAAFTAITAVRAASGHHFATYRGPTLDGLRYLAIERPHEYAAVRWFERNVAGTPVLLEAQGPPYQSFARMTMYTGLATVLGWEHHVSQRGHSRDAIAERRDAVETIYRAPDVASIVPLLRRYAVSYVYVGWLERETYPAAALEKFANAPGVLTLVFEQGDTRIYRVLGEDRDAAPRASGR